jgi:hypothetical protein
MSTILASRNGDRARSGSILLLVLAIVITLTLLAYSFLRVVQIHAEDSNSVQKQMLSREAARDGTDHAIEQILLDFGNTDPAAGPVFTTMDGQGHAAFVPHRGPYNSGAEQAPPSQIGWDDTAQEHTIDEAMLNDWWGGYAGSNGFGWGNGMSDGRGRYYEPEFENQWPGSVTAGWTPNSAPFSINFSQDMSLAPQPPLPDRSNGNFYDTSWHQITGDARSARSQSRYRMRYAVTVVDLDGELLMNPDPGYLDAALVPGGGAVDPATGSPYPGAGMVAYPHVGRSSTGAAIAAPDAPGIGVAAFPAANQPVSDALMARVMRAQYALADIVFCESAFQDGTAPGQNDSHLGSGSTGGERAAHVFAGRGYTDNFDQDPAHLKFAPQTFPFMYRALMPNQVGGFLDPNIDPAPFTNPDGVKLIASNAYQVNPGTNADFAGGEPLPAQWELQRLQMGPQYSFKNMEMAVYGKHGESWTNGDFDDGVFSPWDVYSPFGRGLSATTAATSRYQARVDSPWCVNVMTAPPRLVFGMIAAYMPPGAVNVLFQDQPPPPWGHGSASPADASIGNGSGASNRGDLYGQNDLFVGTQSPAFARYAPPVRPAMAPNPAIVPDYHVPMKQLGDPGFRQPADRYPGVICYNGMTASGFHTDDLGKYLRVDAATSTKVGYQVSPNYEYGDDFDPWSGGGLCAGFWLHYWVLGQPQTPGYLGFSGNPNNGACIIGPDYNSVWDALGQAMGMAVCVARCGQQRYPTSHCDPATVLNGGPNSALPPVNSLRDVDALFLANLGIDINAPTAPPAGVTSYYGRLNGSTWTLTSFHAQYNVASLNNGGPPLIPAPPAAPAPAPPPPPYTTQEQTQLMELLINDMRMSFFGCNPAYPTFMPLDLNGDGQAACSCYPSVGPGAEYDKGIDHHAPVGTAPTYYFCNTGCFNLGKSRFWRIKSRGEVWDNVLNKTLSEGILDTVLCVDPAAADQPEPLADPTAGQYSTHVIYQRWWYDLYRGLMSRKM